MNDHLFPFSGDNGETFYSIEEYADAVAAWNLSDVAPEFDPDFPDAYERESLLFDKAIEAEVQKMLRCVNGVRFDTVDGLLCAWMDA